MDKPPSEPICAENPQSLSPPRKVGIVTTHSEQDNPYEIKIYLINVDLDSCGIQEHTRVLPAVRFRFPHTPRSRAICLLNSTVYIFGGCRFDYQSEPEAKSAHKFVLSPDVLARPNYPVQLGKKTQIAEISLMKFAKCTPEALPTPDGQKIIVFSCTITLRDCNRAFELYDPNGDYWEQLPPFPCGLCNSQFHEFPCSLCTSDEPLSVKNYSFLDESRFLIEFEIGAFVLDLNNRAAWTALRGKFRSFEGYFVAVKGRYALTPERAYDLGDDGYYTHKRNGFSYTFERVQLSTFARTYLPKWEWEWERGEEPRSLIVPLRPVLENGVCNTCVLQLDPCRRLVNEVRVLIDVCRTELSTLNTTVSNCVRLYIDFIEDYSDITLVSV